MKTILVLIIVLVSQAFSLSDTVSTAIVAPGVVHTQYTLPGPFTLDVLEVDITNPLLTFETYKPAGGLTKTTVQSAANDKVGHRVIGAINGGFFSFETGWPVHNQVANGKPVLGISQSKSSFVFTENRKVYLDRFGFSGKIFAKNGATLVINESNTTQAAAKTILYSSFKGSATGTDASFSEAVLEVLTKPLAANDTLHVVIKQKSLGNSAIPAEGFVISGGSGAPATFITNNFSIGDTVKLFLTFNPTTPAAVKHLTQLISGNGHLIKDGVAFPTLGDYDQSGASFNNARHPRTFVGLSDDSMKVYLCTVDGRQSSSLGMNFTEMANFLLTLGIKDAFNLDGGGSTTMVVRGAVVNSPSDPGGERSVANTLQIISTAPVGTLHYLNLLENKADVFQGNSFQFHAEGKDEYYNPLSLPIATVWSCDTTIGTIDAAGLFAAKNSNDSGWVRISFNGIFDSARVFVRVFKEIRVYPSSLVMTPGEQATLTIKGIDSGNNGVTILGTQVVPAITGQGINFSPNDNVVTATGFNKGSFQLSLDTVKLKLNYDFNGTDTAIIAEKFSNLFLWNQDVIGTDPDNVFFGLSSDTVFSAPNAYRVFYSFPTVDAVTTQLKTNLPIASRPDSIYIKVYGNGGGHSLKLLFTDKTGEQFYITSPTIVNWTGAWQNVGFKMVSAKPVTSGTLDFPIALNEIQILLGENNPVGSKAVGTIFIDDINIHYPNRTVAPSLLYDFNSGIAGWLQPYGVGSGQTVGITTASKLEYSTEHPYEGSGSGKWTFIDDQAISTNWNIRISRTTSAELADMLRGSYIGAWVWADGKLGITMRTVIRGGATGLCQGPAFPVNHIGWKLIGVRLDENQFTTYITSGKIIDSGNKFNGFHVEANNADVNGKTVILFVDKMVTSALTVPSGFLDFGAAWDSIGNQVKVSWGVNSEISINRYGIERSNDGTSYTEIGTVTAKGNSDTTVRYTYYDNIENLTSAKYRIRQITNDGGQGTTPIINFNLTNVNGEYFSPLTFDLEQNYPNPFNPTTTIQFQIANDALTQLKVYDILGREISTVINQELKAGIHTINWDSSKVASGVYFYRLSSGNFVDTKKMIVAK